MLTTFISFSHLLPYSSKSTSRFKIGIDHSVMHDALKKSLLEVASHFEDAPLETDDMIF